MTGAEVIKEFLVGLGFKIDAGAFKKFEAGLASATKLAMGLGKATAAAAVTVEAGVVKISKQFEDLYYASQRLNSTVEKIKATDYAVAQMGGTAQGARASMESLASFLRSNPGGENFVRSLGVQTRDANGGLRDMADILEDLGTSFRGMPYFMAKVRAGVLGIDELTLQALIRGTGEFSDRYSELARTVGVDSQAAAEASHQFMVQVRDLMAMLELFIGKVLVKLQGPAGDGLRQFAATAMVVLGALVVLAERALEWWGKLDKATSGWATTLLVLLAVLAPIVALLTPAVAGVIALAGAIGLLIDDFQTWREGGKSLIDWSAWSVEIDNVLKELKPLFRALGDLVGALAAIGKAIWEHVGPAVTNIAHATLESIAGGIRLVTNVVKILTSLLKGEWSQAWDQARKGAAQWAEDVGRVFGKLFGNREEGGAPAAPVNAPPASGGAARPGSRAPIGIRNNNPGNLRRWGNAPRNGGFAVFNSADEGLRAMAGNLLTYGRRGDDTVREIISKWAPPNENNTSAYIATVAKALGVNADQRLNLKDAGTLSRLMQAISRHENGGEYYSDDLYRAAANARLGMPSATLGSGRGGGGVQINQKTDIHLNGSGDAAANGRAVAGEQGRVNGDLLRNTRGALR